MNRRTTKTKTPQQEFGKGSERDSKKKSISALSQATKRGVVKRKTASLKPVEIGRKKGPDKKENDKFKTYHTSSTPLHTPLKVDKLRGRAGEDVNVETLSDISKTSSHSSVCSSVSSGLIELLCNFNSESLKSQKLKENIPERDVEKSMQDETLKNQGTYSFVIPTDQPNCDGRIKILSGLLNKLKTTVMSIISSGDSKSVKRLEKIVEIFEKEFEGLENELPALWVQKREFDAEIEAVAAPLKEENASLQRKIRILTQNLAEKERQERENQEKDLNLELETVQCMNNTLVEQIKKLSMILKEVQGEKLKQGEEIADLKQANEKLREDFLHKNTEFAKSQELFSSEAGTIKTEVANALQKVDGLKLELCEAETKNELMRVTIQEKDDEISRLNDLNKGLQSSVSRLLDDLKKASKRPQRTQPQAATAEVSSTILKNLQNLLNAPQVVRHSDDNHDVSWQKSFEPPQSSFTKSYPPRGGKENCHPYPEYIPPGFDLYNDLGLNNYENILESSRISSLRSDPPTPTMGYYGDDPSKSSVTPTSKSTSLWERNGSPVVTTSTKPSSLWEQSSVSSSFVSFTTRDENDFANNLALLDADIQRLQESLHDMTVKPS